CRARRQPGRHHDRTRAACRLHRLGLCRGGDPRRRADRLRGLGQPPRPRPAERARRARHPPPLGRTAGVSRLLRVALLLAPLLVLAGLVAVFAMSMDRDPNLLRSVLIGKPAPDFSLPAVATLDTP